MEDFVYQCATKIIFGRKKEERVGEEVKKYAGNILLHYGQSSIKKYGLYEKVIKSLKAKNISVTELGGVQPNPRLKLVYEGIKICRENNINFILAVGGGSVIDSAKAIAVGVNYEGDVWDFFEMHGKKAKDVLPVGVVLTLPAAGSESSNASVITKEEGLLKKGYGDENIRPKFAILNPELTLTLPKEQTVYGISDIFAHGMERYFTQTRDVDFTDRLLEGSFKSLIKNAYNVIKNPTDYAARAEIMWIGTVIHNDLFGTGRISDWASHYIEHELSAIYDIAHGAGLSIIFPAWMKYVYKKNIRRFAQFADRVLNVDTYFGQEDMMAVEGIKRLESFYRDMGLPTRLKELNISSEKFEEMAEKCAGRGSVGNFVKLNKKDILEIYRLSEE